MISKQLLGVFVLLVLGTVFFFFDEMVQFSGSSTQAGSPSSSNSVVVGNRPAHKKQLRVLVTGGAGFVGFHTSRYLAKRGDKVVGLDSFNHYYDVGLKRDRAKILRDDHGIEVVEGNVCDSELLDKLLLKANATHVLHLAAQAGVRYSLEHPLEYVESNVRCFVILLELLRQPRHQHRYLVYASSSSVYGLNEKIPFAETDPVVQPASLYAATKRSNELIAHVYRNLYGMRSSGLRFFTVYGPYGRPDMAYFSFTKRILAKEPIQVYNHGKVSRDFTYIDDLVPGVAAALDLEAEFDLFNLGSNKPYSVEELISGLEGPLKRKAIKEYTDRAKGDVDRTYADLTHSAARLGYLPTTPLKDGLSNFIDWYVKYYDVEL